MSGKIVYNMLESDPPGSATKESLPSIANASRSAGPRVPNPARCSPISTALRRVVAPWRACVVRAFVLARGGELLH